MTAARRRAVALLSLALLLVVGVDGCSAILGIHDSEIEPQSNVGEGGASSDGSLTDRVARLDSNDPFDGSADGGDAASPSPMITLPNPNGVGTFQIDVTEVTQRQYAEFLARGTSQQQPPECAFNISFTPESDFTPLTTPNNPVVKVDWCDALAYCAWVNKRLCGGVAGTRGAYADSTNPTKNEWLWACTKGNTQAFPYGAVEQPNACNIHTDASLPTASLAACTGGFAGLFDMVGNATEWVDHCDDAGCGIMGGSFNFPQMGAVACAAFTATERRGAFNDLSFRCCR